MEMQIQCAGYSIAADWYDGVDRSKILLVLPGYGSSKARQKDFTKAMVQATGTSAIAVDYSGHGVSPFELRDTRPAQHFLEVIYVFDWLREQYPDAVISVAGSSYGGFMGVQLTKYREFANLVLRAPAIYKPAAFYDPWSVRLDNEEEYAKALHAYREDAEALARHPLLGRASSFKGRVLVVVHEQDELVLQPTTDAYIKAFNADSYLAEGFSHSVDAGNLGPEKLQAYQDYMADWLSRS